MSGSISKKTIAIVGGGAAALLIYKRLVAAKGTDFSISIYEESQLLGAGMPYSSKGARLEHVTNVSADELPEFIPRLDDWVKSLPSTTLSLYGINKDEFHEKETLPRLLFGQYLDAQFHMLVVEAKNKGIETLVHYQTRVSGIRIDQSKAIVSAAGREDEGFDIVVICTGHYWPKKIEGKVERYFDSPYPPDKLSIRINHPAAVRGSSLTAVDAVRTMSRSNGKFEDKNDRLMFIPAEASENFRVIMVSRQGMLPCVRVHMEEPHSATTSITQEAIAKNMQDNDGFLELDFLFDEGFKSPLKKSDPLFYEEIKEMSLETFVDAMMKIREEMDPFALLRKEYHESKKSIEKEYPVYWKERLAALSFVMNYPAKYLSAEDMLRLQKHLLPLISVVIAFMPQRSCEELLALHEAGRLALIADGGSGTVSIRKESDVMHYEYKDESGNPASFACETFVDATGQKHLSLAEFPFQDLLQDGQITQAKLKFRSARRAEELLLEGQEDIESVEGNYYLKVAGANISDNFAVVNANGQASKQIYLMAVPYMGGFNPDYSGLDFCEHASELIVQNIMDHTEKGMRKNSRS